MSFITNIKIFKNKSDKDQFYLFLTQFKTSDDQFFNFFVEYIQEYLSSKENNYLIFYLFTFAVLALHVTLLLTVNNRFSDFQTYDASTS